MPAPLGGPSFSRSRCCRPARHPNPLPIAIRAQVPAGVIGNFLAGRFALAEGDSHTAANDLLKAVAQSPGDPELTLQAFIACLNAGRPEAVKLARQLPDNQVAQLVLADVDIKAGRWQDAEAAFSCPAAPGHDAVAAAVAGGLGAAGRWPDRYRAVHACGPMSRTRASAASSRCRPR